jgi:hypothetical protein
MAQALMISPNCESIMMQIAPPLVNNHHHSQKLFFVGRELLITDTKAFAEICYSVTFLCEYSSNLSITSIYLYNELLREVRKC